MTIRDIWHRCLTTIGADSFRVNVVAGGAGDGAIQDGANSSIEATVLDYTNSNPLAVRLTDTNGDYIAAGAGTQYNDGAARGSATGTLILGDDSTNLQSLACDTAGKLLVKVEDGGNVLSVDDGAGSLTVDGSVSIASALPAGDNNIGNVDIVTMPNVTLAAGTNTNEVVGDAAHGAAVAGNPVLQAGEGRSTEPTAVDDGDVVRPLHTLLGKQINHPHALPGASWRYAAAAGGITDTTAVTLVAAAGAGIRNYITSLQVVNSHAAVNTEVVIRDGSGGTVIWRGWARANGSNMYQVIFPVPLRGSANTLLEAACVTTGTATLIDAQGYSAAE